MAVSTTLPAIAQRIMKDLNIGFVIENAALGTIGATSVVSTKYFQNARVGSDHYASQGYIITRPGAASAADMERPAGDVTVSSGTLAHGGANWSDTTLGTEDFEMWKHGVRRSTDVLDAINYARTQLFATTYIPLSDLSGGSNDGDMASAATSAYTSVATPTLSKVTTARRTPYGQKALRVLSSGADEGVRMPTVGMRSLRQMRWLTIVSSDVGGVTLSPYDITAGATFGTSITIAEEEPQLVMSPWETVPTSCLEATFQGLGTTTTSDNYFNMVWLYRMGNRRIELPSYITETYQTPQIFQGRPMYGGQTSYCFDALALEFTGLQEGKDWLPVSNQVDANPNAIVLQGDGYYDYPLFAAARRSYYDMEGALSAESDTTKCPLNLLAARAEIELLDRKLIKVMAKEEWAVLRSRAEKAYQEATTSRPVVTMAQELPYWRGPGGGRKL